VVVGRTCRRVTAPPTGPLLVTAGRQPQASRSHPLVVVAQNTLWPSKPCTDIDATVMMGQQEGRRHASFEQGRSVIMR
jgi:hypothetical protein